MFLPLLCFARFSIVMLHRAHPRCPRTAQGKGEQSETGGKFTTTIGTARSMGKQRGELMKRSFHGPPGIAAEIAQLR
jgi:hypothetical protein